MSNKKGKIKIRYVFLVLLLILLSGAAGYMVMQNNKTHNKLNTTHKVSNKSVDRGSNKVNDNNIDDNKTNNDKEKPKAIAEYVVYDILGKSKNLTSKQWNSMQEWRDSVKSIAEKNQSLVYLNGQPSTKSVCLTFDDGPDNVITSKIIDVLNSYNVKGNFMFMGKEAATYPLVVKKAYESGHLIGCHSYDHKDFTTLTADEIKSEITKTDDVFYKEIGKYPIMIRPPYGSTNDTVNSCLSELGRKEIIWSIDTLDWSQKEPANIVKNVTDNLRSGEIILMHSNSDKSETLKALPEIIEKIRENGYTITTLDKMLNCDGYK